MKQQFFGVRLTTVAEDKRTGRARGAAEQSLRRKLQPVVHARHRPVLLTAVGKRGELTTATAELPGSARIRAYFLALDDQAGQALHDLGRHARDPAREPDVVQAVLGRSRARPAALEQHERIRVLVRRRPLTAEHGDPDRCCAVCHQPIRHRAGQGTEDQARQKMPDQVPRRYGRWM